MKNRCQFLSNYLEQIDGVKPSKSVDKHVKMATDPFLFFRGSSQLFYHDLAHGVLLLPDAFSQVPNTSIMGDCHVANFGFFTEEGSHGDHVIFAPNDFDDACIGQAVWDIARFVVSLKLAANFGHNLSRSCDKRFIGKLAINDQQAQDAIHGFLTAYLNTCQHSVTDPTIQTTALDEFSSDHILHKHFVKAKQRSASGTAFETKSSLAKATCWQNGKLRFKQLCNKFAPIDNAVYQDIAQTFSPYVNDDILDIVARHGAGTGSLNLARYYLLVGPKQVLNKADLALCHIVEVKQQRPAAPLYHFKNISEINRLNPAHLTVQCQRRMQRNPDLILDEVIWNNQYWLVRSRHHAKVGMDPEKVVLGKKAVEQQGFTKYATACGQALALSHCRNDRRSTRFEQQMSHTLHLHKLPLVDACLAYVEQVNLDTQSLIQLINL